MPRKSHYLIALDARHYPRLYLEMSNYFLHWVTALAFILCSGLANGKIPKVPIKEVENAPPSTGEGEAGFIPWFSGKREFNPKNALKNDNAPPGNEEGEAGFIPWFSGKRELIPKIVLQNDNAPPGNGEGEAGFIPWFSGKREFEPKNALQNDNAPPGNGEGEAGFIPWFSGKRDTNQKMHYKMTMHRPAMAKGRLVSFLGFQARGTQPKQRYKMTWYRQARERESKGLFLGSPGNEQSIDSKK
ncbi:predicted protein [Nematostella vectensis]|uniref:Uncharacterized protein n=1 Tax=Nematostella vectensis TaxID=45351 RepID=A7RM18_NEMVE|nr:predicted protein [Nematostella vectensis]|eukprot:XP_001639491.1 predicted protein [Nematostella vectensis]